VLPVGGFAAADVTTDFTSFQAAGAVPEYLSTVSSAVVSTVDYGQWQGFDILGFGAMNVDMSGTGGRPEIGPYPQWAARYIAHGSAALRAETIGYGDLAGSFSGDYTTADPAAFVTAEDDPLYWLDLDLRGEAGHEPLSAPGKVTLQNAHKPSLAYIPYLVTGTRYYSDEIGFHANFGILSTWPSGAWTRSGGMVWQNEMRGLAWVLRDIADAAAYLPDASPYQAYFRRAAQANLQGMDSYAAGLDSPLGYVGFGAEHANGTLRAAPWQYAYLAWSIDHTMNQLASTDGTTIRNQLLRNVIEPMLGQPGFDPRQAAGYWVAFGTEAGSNGPITFYQTWAQVFDANYRNADGTLVAYRPWVGSYGPELRLAAVLAKQAGLTGAAAALAFAEAQDDGSPGAFMTSLNDRSAFAIAAVASADQPTPPIDLAPILQQLLQWLRQWIARLIELLLAIG
jgi:hypothetical protein